jgi:hypothetical protein
MSRMSYRRFMAILLCLSVLMSIAELVRSYVHWESQGLFRSNSRTWFVLTTLLGASVVLIPYALVAAVAKEMKYAAFQLGIGFTLFSSDLAARREAFLKPQSSTAALIIVVAYALVIGVALPLVWGLDRVVWRARGKAT